MKEPKTEATPVATEVRKPDLARIAALKDLPKVEIETYDDKGPCGEGDPCGGGFGSRD